MPQVAIKKEISTQESATRTLAQSLFKEFRGRGLSTKEIINLSSYLIEMLIEEQKRERQKAKLSPVSNIP